MLTAYRFQTSFLKMLNRSGMKNTILCMSLSKLGLPGVRCGIVIASEEVTQALTNMNGIISLAPNSVGPAIANHMIEKGDFTALKQRGNQTFL